jgi:hypothetical protein
MNPDEPKRRTLEELMVAEDLGDDTIEGAIRGILLAAANRFPNRRPFMVNPPPTQDRE